VGALQCSNANLTDADRALVRVERHPAPALRHVWSMRKVRRALAVIQHPQVLVITRLYPATHKIELFARSTTGWLGRLGLETEGPTTADIGQRQRPPGASVTIRT
jgi:hypothetical protein